jgi:hypothetical protein
VAELWAEAVRFTSDQAKKGQKRKRSVKEEGQTEEQERLKRNSRRAATLAGEGQFTRALQALTSNGMAEQTTATVKAMREKHPPAPNPIGPLPTTEHTPLSVSSQEVLKAATRFRKGSAPGPSGLRPEHLRSALLSFPTRRDGALTALTRLTNRMLAGKVPAVVAPYLCGARLHAAKKKDGGIRPIAVGNLLRRLTSKCAAVSVAGKAAALLSPLQVGVGVRGGCEAVVHAARQAVKNNPGKYMLQADLINAFNQGDRGAALHEVREHFPELLPWAVTSYSAPSHLRFGSADIPSATGFHQGDPLAALLFALVLHPIILKIRERVPSLDLNVWFLDDGTMVGTLEELELVVDILSTDGPAKGLILSTANTVPHPAKPKTTVWSLMDDERMLTLSTGACPKSLPPELPCSERHWGGRTL